MAKDPAFLFYSSDFLTGTMFMNDAQVGRYIRLLCAQHQHGGLIDKQSFNLIVGDDSFLRGKFKESENGFFNQRLSEEMDKRKKKSIKLSANAKQKKSKCKAIAKQIENENENENENEIGLKIERPSKSEIENDLFNDQLFIEQLQMTHKGKDIRQAWGECWTHHISSPNPPRESWEWRQKLNTWLSIKSNNNGKSNGTPKHFDKDKLARLIEAKYSREGTAE